MEVNKNSCESCGMTIEAGPYCEYCTDEAGQLQQFDERFARLVQFVKRRDQGLSQEAAAVKNWSGSWGSRRQHGHAKE